MEKHQRAAGLGPADKVAEVLSQWLASIDDGESVFRDIRTSRRLTR